jgi:hypothetical protein
MAASASDFTMPRHVECPPRSTFHSARCLDFPSLRFLNDGRAAFPARRVGFLSRSVMVALGTAPLSAVNH